MENTLTTIKETKAAQPDVVPVAVVDKTLAPAETAPVAATETENEKTKKIKKSTTLEIENTSEKITEENIPAKEQAPLQYHKTTTERTETTHKNPESDGIRIISENNQLPERIDLAGLENKLTQSPGKAPKSLDYYLNGQHAFTGYNEPPQLIMANPEASKDDHMILSALLLSKTYIGGAIELTGSDEFKQRAIKLIAAYDLPLSMKNEQQQQMLNEAKATLSNEPPLPEQPAPLGSEANKILAESKPVPAPDLPPGLCPHLAAAADVPRNASHQEAKNGVTGTLIESGFAPYNFEKDADSSFYIHMRTAKGEQILWGKELRSALNDSNIHKGDMMTVTLLGRKTATVNAHQRDENGVILKENVVSERNNWTIKPAIDPAIVSADIKQMTPLSELQAYPVHDYKVLHAFVAELANKAGVSIPALSDLPDTLWSNAAGNGVQKPSRQPDKPHLPSGSPDAGQLLFSATDAQSKLKLLLVKAQGDFIQGAVQHADTMKPILGRICQDTNGNPHITLNEITPDGLKKIGHGYPVNNETGNYNSYLFQLTGEKHRLYAQLVAPEKRSPALQHQLGFTHPPALTPRRENKPQPAPSPSTPRPAA